MAVYRLTTYNNAVIIIWLTPPEVSHLLSKGQLSNKTLSFCRKKHYICGNETLT